MTPEEALLDYLYPRLVGALQTWKGFDDMYGIWLGVSLLDDVLPLPSLSDILLLRELCAQERTSAYGNRWAPGMLGYEEQTLKPWLCSDPWPLDNEDYAHLKNEGIFDPGDPKGCALRDAYFAQKRTQPEYLDPTQHPTFCDLELQELIWFLDVCGKLIGKLHETGVVTEVCGKPVPIGIFFNNDLDTTLPLAAVQTNNPAGLAQGMEAWMLEQHY